MARRTLCLCILFAGALSAADRLTLTGTVTDTTGKLLDREASDYVLTLEPR